MNRATKAVLLSGLVFPGAGHIYLQCYKRGVALIAVASISVSVIVIKVMEQVSSILGQLDRNSGVVDPDKIMGMLNQSSNSMDNDLINAASIVIFVSWVYGMVDAHRIGKD